jgi:hypothetical protein
MIPDNPNYNPLFTLNIKRGIDGTHPYPTGTKPSVQYFGVGIGGRRYITDTSGTVTSVRPVLPSTDNQDLYKPIPVRMVPAASDLSEQDRANYRIRTTATINGQSYILYWLKVIDKDAAGIKFSKVDNNGAVVDYTLESNLSPQIPGGSQGPVVQSSKSRITVGFTGTCALTNTELDSYVKLYIDATYGASDYIISELGIYHGVDDSNTVNAVTYTEAYGAQLATHICYQGLPWPTSTTTFEEKILLQHGSALLS